MPRANLCRRRVERNTQTRLGGFRQKISDERRLYRWLESGNAARIRYRAMPFGDQAMFFARSVYEEVGGVEAVPLMEDVKLSRALRRRSWPLLLKGPCMSLHVDGTRMACFVKPPAIGRSKLHIAWA